MPAAATGSMAVPLSGLCKDVWVLPEAGQSQEQSAAVLSPTPVLERTASDLPDFPRLFEGLHPAAGTEKVTA